jgi:hypothetical protein
LWLLEPFPFGIQEEVAAKVVEEIVAKAASDATAEIGIVIVV